MDGTFLREDHQIGAETQVWVKRLSDRGIPVIPVSARPLHGMLPITRSVLPDHLPIVSLNGGYIYHQNNIIRRLHLTEETAARVADLFLREPVSPMYYTDMEWHAHELDAAVLKEQKITPTPVQLESIDSAKQRWLEQQHGPNKILLAGSPDIIESLEQTLKHQFGGALHVSRSQSRYVEIMPAAATKKEAIEFLLPQLQVQPEEIIAFGDNYNDVDMIRFAGLGVAMGNAPEPVKAVADEVTSSNNEEGIARVLERIFG